MKGQTLGKKKGFVDFHSWENYMKGLKPEIVVTKFYTQKFIYLIAKELVLNNK